MEIADPNYCANCGNHEWRCECSAQTREIVKPIPSAGLHGSTAIESAKVAAISACCGIKNLPDAELLARLEELFWKGFKEAERLHS